jgi:hypothetical protein
MPCVGFEPTIPEFERAKTVHALDCVATVVGRETDELHKFSFSCKNGFAQMSLSILVLPSTYACLDNLYSSGKAVADIGILL